MYHINLAITDPCVVNLLRVRNSNSLQIGLAVGDIDNIQKNAVMDRYRVQVQTVLVLFLFVIK